MNEKVLLETGQQALEAQSFSQWVDMELTKFACRKTIGRVPL